VDVTYLRVLAFVLSALFAGIAGSLWAHFSAFISPETFDLLATIRFVSMLLIGGAGTALGPLAGALLLTYLPEWLRFMESFYMGIYGLSIVLILIFAPKGLVGLADRLLGRKRGNAETQKRGDGETDRRVLRPTGGANKSPLPAGEGQGEGNLSVAPQVSPRHENDPSPRPSPTAVGEGALISPSPRGGGGRGVGSVPSPAALITHRPSLLETQGLTMAFGGLVAVRSVDLSVAEGEIRGIIGPNGSGKTTILNLVSGIYRPTAGRILLDGEQVDGDNPSVLVHKGIARTFQNIRLFPRLTVLDNVKVAGYCRSHAGLAGISLRTPGTAAEDRRIEADAINALEFVGLPHLTSSLPGDLPYGQQRLVELARALATGPRLLLLDEPAAGMSLAEKQRLARLVREINQKSGITIVVIEHDMKIISGLCHQVTVLNFGEVIAEGAPHEARENEAVIEAYLGRSKRRARTR